MTPCTSHSTSASGLVGRVVLTDDETGFDLVIFHKGLILSFGPAN